MANEIDVKDFQEHYSEKKLFEKIIRYAKLAGIKMVYIVLLLFYALKKPNLPVKVRGTIIGALGYFIFPMDLISDLIPVVGYTDDMALLLAALGITAFYIDDEVKIKANEKLKEIFGDYDDNELKEVNEKMGK